MKVILLAVVVILQMSMASAASKAKKYDWNDSNMDKFGSGKDKKATKASAMSNTAWQGAGQEVGLQIWRIVKSKVTDWDKASYGEFYNGDSYIILNTYTETPESKELKYDIHFWIGKYSTQDEYGAAQYNAVELDTFLDDKAVQHREVQGHESDLFKSYFDVLTLLKGGADTSFQRVVPGEYSPRFFHVKKQGNRRITVTQISMKRSNLNDDDVFILDNGQIIYQINGRSCTGDVKYKAAQEVQKLKSRMGNIRSETVEMRSVSPNHPALKLLDDGESSIGVVAGSTQFSTVIFMALAGVGAAFTGYGIAHFQHNKSMEF